MTSLPRVLLSTIALAFATSFVNAQQLSAVTGTVLSDVDEKPVPGAEVSILGLALSTTSDSIGAFHLGGVPAGRQTVTVRKIGFGPISTVLTFAADDTLHIEFTLVPTTTRLPEVDVKTAAPLPTKLSAFEERRKRGFGHFLTASDLAKTDGRQMSEIISTIPGTNILRGKMNAAWLVGGRGTVSVLLNGPDSLQLMDRLQGARRGLCYSAVVLDGIFVYQGNRNEKLFDINSIQASEIAGMEVYTGAATIPVQYEGVRTTCGLLIIWTK